MWPQTDVWHSPWDEWQIPGASAATDRPPLPRIPQTPVSASETRAEMSAASTPEVAAPPAASVRPDPVVQAPTPASGKTADAAPSTGPRAAQAPPTPNGTSAAKGGGGVHPGRVYPILRELPDPPAALPHQQLEINEWARSSIVDAFGEPGGPTDPAVLKASDRRRDRDDARGSADYEGPERRASATPVVPDPWIRTPAWRPNAETTPAPERLVEDEVMLTDSDAGVPMASSSRTDETPRATGPVPRPPTAPGGDPWAAARRAAAREPARREADTERETPPAVAASPPSASTQTETPPATPAPEPVAPAPEPVVEASPTRSPDVAEISEVWGVPPIAEVAPPAAPAPTSAAVHPTAGEPPAPVEPLAAAPSHPTPRTDAAPSPAASAPHPTPPTPPRAVMEAVRMPDAEPATDPDASADADAFIGRYAICGLGRVGRIESVQELEFGRTFIGSRVHDGQLWATTAPKLIDEADALFLDRVRRIAEMDLDRIVASAVRRALDSAELRASMSGEVLAELRRTLGMDAAPESAGTSPETPVVDPDLPPASPRPS